MINDHTLGRFAKLDQQLLKPIYADYSFANIPATAHRLLTGETIGPLIPPDAFGGSYPAPEKVVLVFIDCFGWGFWQRFLERSRILGHVAREGVLTPISALFPSTTSASVTSLNLGILPARHGIYEWNLYVPAFGEVIQSLPFALLGHGPLSATTKGYDPKALFSARPETAHQRLAARGVASYQIASRAYSGSPYNVIASAGAEVVPYGTLAEALVLVEEATRRPGKAFINFYWAGIDTSAHIHGPGSPEHDAEVEAFLAVLDRLLGRNAAKDTLWLFTADHGHIAVPAEKTLYVNRHWPEMRRFLATSPTGETIWPCGSPRDMFLHIRPDCCAEALSLLAEGLAGRARVMTVNDALARGLFGDTSVTPDVRARLGDILVLPYLGEFVWWHEPGLISNRMNGHHGGLTPEELITVLGVAGSLS